MDNVRDIDIEALYDSRQDNNEKSFKMLPMALVFFWPFAGLIYSLYHWKEKWAKNAFWFFCVYLGAIHIYWPEGTTLGVGADAGRYYLRMLNLRNTGATIQTIFSSYLKEYNVMDLYFPLISLLVGKVTDNGHVFFAVLAFVFGYFYSRNIWYVLERLPEKSMGLIAMFVCMFFMICPVSQINAVRMMTGLHVYVYALLPYLYERNTKRVWLVALVPFIHFSFLYVTVIALAYILLPYLVKINSKTFRISVITIFIISMTFTALDFGRTAELLLRYSPVEYSRRISGYVNQNTAESRASKVVLTNWYVKVAPRTLLWTGNLLLLGVFFVLMKKRQKHENLWHFLMFTMILRSFANAARLVPSGGRFQVVSNMFLFALFILLYPLLKNSRGVKRIVICTSCLLLLPLAVECRRQVAAYGVSALVGNYVTAIFWDNNRAILPSNREAFRNRIRGIEEFED